MVFGIASNTKLQNDVFCLTEERDYFQAKFLEQVSEIANLKDELRKSKKEIGKLRKELMRSPSASGGIMTPRSHHGGGGGGGNSIANSSCVGPSSSVASPRRLDYHSPRSHGASTSGSMGGARSPRPQHHQEEKKEDEGDDLHAMVVNTGNPQRNHTTDDGDFHPRQPQPRQFPSKDDDDEEDDADDASANADEQDDLSSRESCESSDEDDDDKDADSAKDIRQSAEKLLQWATYRSSIRTSSDPNNSSRNSTPRSSSVATAASESILDPTPHAILSIDVPAAEDEERYPQDSMLDDDDDDDDGGHSIE